MIDIVCEVGGKITLRGFRPLSGKWGYRSRSFLLDYEQFTIRFPSPLGEMGLSIISLIDALLWFGDQVSVPSRGNGVIDCTTNNNIGR